MSNYEAEAHEREIMIKMNMDGVQFDEYISRILNEGNQIDMEDVELLILRLVKKYRKMSGDKVQEVKEKLTELLKKKYKIEKQFQKKNSQLKKSDRDQIAKKQWSMIRVMQFWLLLYALFDFMIQIVYQMPLVLPEDRKFL